jgi:site-specific recombinase XerD
MANLRGHKRWEEIVSEFEEHLFGLGRAQNSISTYGTAIRDFGRFYRGELKKPGPYPSKLRGKDLQAFVDYLRSTRYLTTASVNTKIAALNAFSRYLLEKKLHRQDIARDLRTDYVSRSPRIPRLSSGETRRLVTSVDLNKQNGIRDLAILQLFLQCGLRVHEVTLLCVDDVELRKKTGRVRIRDQKTRAERMVPLNASTRNALGNYLKTRGHVSGNEPLFLSQQKKRMSSKNVKYLVKKYLCMAGRSDLSARDLRHNFARRLFEKSGDLSIVQHILGHRNIATTARYIQPTQADIAVAVEALAEDWYQDEQRDRK